VEVQGQGGAARELAAEIARRLGDVAVGRPRLVVDIEQFGDTAAVREMRAALEKLLERDVRIVVSRLADGVSVPEPPPAGGGYSEAIGLRIPTPPPDVTVQLSDSGVGVSVEVLLHKGPTRIERLFRLGQNR
jgi:hypothetical protein